MTKLRQVFYTAALGVAAAIAWRYPWSADPKMPEQKQRGQSFYETAYASSGQPDDPGLADDQNTPYLKAALQAAKEHDIEGQARRFAQTYGLENGKILDVGAGRGYLQDIVEDYTGLDISPSARRFFHKKFVQASATAMPFPDSHFDAAWSVWVLEHVPNPEHALIETRRVVKDGGYLLLYPAWNCAEWLAEGYQVRPYSDFGWPGKIYKWSVLWQQLAEKAVRPAVRAIRWGQQALSGGSSRFRYRLLTPNYKEYWLPDSDALNSLDYFETALWFESRGDECVNCPSRSGRLTRYGDPLIIRIHKSDGARISRLLSR